jgi:hypothetical protein
MALKSRCKFHNKELSKRQGREKREWLKKLKLEAGCVDCGYRAHPDALDFDHLPEFEKSFAVSRGASSKSWDTLKKEVDKCVVRCANCHRIKTSQRNQSADVTQAT